MKTESTIKSIISQLKKEYPNVKKIEVSYNGNGDSFDSFTEIKGIDDDVDAFTTKYDEVIWAAIDNSDADFNNDGSEGEVVFDLEKGEIYVENYWIEEIRNRNHSGTFTLTDKKLNKE